ncbi:MAG: hypothetical protein LC808_24450 [Actinobacteria bacterium]|nr:hypothetical protein [Actinomycetota bacterium]
MGAAIVRRGDLDVLTTPPAIWLLVLDSSVREVHLVVEVRQVMFVCPLADLIWRSIRVSVVVIVVTVALVKPALVLALELMVEHDAIDARAPLEEPRLGLFVGAVDLDVVFQFAGPYKARVERLLTLVVRVLAMLEKAAAFLGEHHRMVAVARHADGLDQPLLSKVSEVAGPWVGGSIVVV